MIIVCSFVGFSAFPDFRKEAKLAWVDLAKG
jgi:hypothetical protein